MIVLIPYTPDYANGQELMFAIRSMDKYFTSMTGLVLVGYKPSWYTGDHIFTPDEIGRKEYSMYLKAMLGAKTFKAQEFLYTTDDHFALKKFDENLPNYYNSTCGEMARTHTHGRYRTQYKNCEPGWYNFDIHVPIIMSPFNWPSHMRETDPSIKSWYGNQYSKREPIEIEDCKFGNPHSYEQIKKIIKGKPFFSTSPFCMNSDMIKVLNELYPNKSKFEK